MRSSSLSPRDATPAEIIEMCAQIAEGAVGASSRVRDKVAPEAPIAGLENALHGIVVTTARGIARNIRALAEQIRDPDTRGEANQNGEDGI